GAPGVMVTSGLVGVMVSPCVGGSSHPTPRRRGARRQAKSARALRAFREVSPAVPSCPAAGRTADPNRAAAGAAVAGRSRARGRCWAVGRTTAADRILAPAARNSAAVGQIAAAAARNPAANPDDREDDRLGPLLQENPLARGARAF